jgi:hypothetical protein
MKRAINFKYMQNRPTLLFFVFALMLFTASLPAARVEMACELFHLEVVKGDCTSDSTYSLTFDFEYQGVNGSKFDLWVNGHFYGSYLYSALPVTLPHFPKSGGSKDWIKVCDQGTPGCCKTTEFTTKDCQGNQDCSISGLSVAIGDCTSDSTYELTIDFQVNHPGGSQFKLYANGVEWEDYNYADLPITIMDFPQSAGSHDWVKVCDKEIPGCCAIKEYKNPGCGGNSGDCHFKELHVTKECDGDSLFYVEINFAPVHPGANGFRIKGNGVAYSDLPITLGPLPANCSTPYEFLIYDLDDPACKVVYEMGKVCCQNHGECPLKGLTVDIGECNNDGTYPLQLNVTHQAAPADSFQLWVNGQSYGMYSYGDLPIHIPQFPPSGHSHDWVKVCDQNTHNCCLIKEFASPKCEGGGGDCQFKELHVSKTCDGDSLFFVTIQFVPVNPGNLGFKIQGNGHNYGSFDYNDLPIELGPFAADCHTSYEFLLQDIANPNCKKVYHLGKVCCGHHDGCQIKELHVDTGDCDSDSTYQLTIQFEVHPANNSEYQIWVNGEWYGQYPIADLPLTLEGIPSSIHSKERLKVCTADEPLCCKEIFYSAPKCIYKGYQYHAFGGKIPHEQGFNALIGDGEEKQFREMTFALQGADGTLRSYTLPTSEEAEWQVRLIDLQGRILLERRGQDDQGLVILQVPSGMGSRILLFHLRSGSNQEVHKVFVSE